MRWLFGRSRYKGIYNNVLRGSYEAPWKATLKPQSRGERGLRKRYDNVREILKINVDDLPFRSSEFNISRKVAWFLMHSPERLYRYITKRTQNFTAKFPHYYEVITKERAVKVYLDGNFGNPNSVSVTDNFCYLGPKTAVSWMNPKCSLRVGLGIVVIRHFCCVAKYFFSRNLNRRNPKQSPTMSVPLSSPSLYFLLVFTLIILVPQIQWTVCSIQWTVAGPTLYDHGCKFFIAAL